MGALKTFPFSYWNRNFWENVAQTSRQTENMTAWFTQWTSAVETSRQTENMTSFLAVPLNAAVETSRQTEDFAGVW